MAYGEARLGSRSAAWGAAGWSLPASAARYAARNAAWGAIAALIAWDHSAKYLNMPVDQLKVWGALSEDLACILLLPAVRVFEKINELELV